MLLVFSEFALETLFGVAPSAVIAAEIKLKKSANQSLISLLELMKTALGAPKNGQKTRSIKILWLKTHFTEMQIVCNLLFWSINIV